MKFRRSERLIDMTNYLLEHPRQLVSLTYFSERYKSAKSSISEDLAIIKDTFEQRGIGTLQTVPGAAGGVKFQVKVTEEEAKSTISELCEIMASPDRLLPGGYLYMTDIIGNPSIVNRVGRLFASAFGETQIDVVMTVATKGISLAYATANYLNVPVVIVRKDSKVTEGSTVSINYVSGSTKRLSTMMLSKRSLAEGSRVLIVDDFLRGGGTVNGMVSMLEEFKAHVAGIAVLVEAEKAEERLVDEYLSLLRLSDIDEREKKINVNEGNYFKNK
ncbi:pur operon repressor [Bacillus sp. DTU_2020_1000418_1_SI_GHA_SEK_038]|uniref:pur operon repressor n=1 Tax=Bacillus sp. DTU_2020_1000418_1_SI_GHA_SEK_038 TaxID=3077585 RepID=UPI0028E42AA9|nr:pur operon repressor [Bacillus sp. DTU_2020_1000418_1_SI_GHA_SEK_038]WNS77499.1 pur operon repressor [Bacillus sp. DTU_2020_1000418_1_SI_GHA_SEK_038]